MTTLPLRFTAGHLFLEIDGRLWLLDTGSPASFGSEPSLALDGESFRLDPSALGLDAASLSTFVSVDCAGLLGGDVLSRFDLVLDVPGGTARVSRDELDHAGAEVPLDFLIDIPIVEASVRGARRRFFFDTGAQVSYLEGPALATFPPAGPFADFYPGVGAFATETFTVDFEVGGLPFPLRTGSLPGLLALTLPLGRCAGILGNALLADRAVGYFPRRRRLVL